MKLTWLWNWSWQWQLLFGQWILDVALAKLSANKQSFKRQVNASALFKHNYKLEITVHNSESETHRYLPPGLQISQNEVIICVYVLNKIICPNHFQSWVQSITLQLMAHFRHWYPQVHIEAVKGVGTFCWPPVHGLP